MHADILTAIRAMGITLSVDGGNLITRPKAALTDELRSLIREHKTAILAALACPAADLVQARLDYVQDLVVYAEERRQPDDAAGLS